MQNLMCRYRSNSEIRRDIANLQVNGSTAHDPEAYRSPRATENHESTGRGFHLRNTNTLRLNWIAYRLPESLLMSHSPEEISCWERAERLYSDHVAKTGFEELVGLLQPELVHYFELQPRLRAVDPRDLASRTLEALYFNKNPYFSQHHSGATFRTWVEGIARNIWRKERDALLRQLGVRPLNRENDVPAIEPETHWLSDVASELPHARACLWRCVLQLDEAPRLMILLRFSPFLSTVPTFGQISQIFNDMQLSGRPWTESMVRAVWDRAKKKLLPCVQDCLRNPPEADESQDTRSRRP